jgi:hypothetical protein
VTIIFGGCSVLLPLFRAQKNGIIKATTNKKNHQKNPILSFKKEKKEFFPKRKRIFRTLWTKM